jgi:hypothetical protein
MPEDHGSCALFCVMAWLISYLAHELAGVLWR